jgi:LmbE family N-acetylglucosaminyl deacetylase
MAGGPAHPGWRGPVPRVSTSGKEDPRLATYVFFHAHPDDEAIATGGTMIRAADAGHRVVLVVATRGEMGEPPELRGERLSEIRAGETLAAAELLGVDRVEFLGYRDSGMSGDPENGRDGAFAAADLDEAASRLAVILAAESADVLTVYDEHGGYGHPDHIQVHRVGHRAAVVAGVAPVYEATINRDRIRDVVGVGSEETAESSGNEAVAIGLPEGVITTAVDVTEVLDRKRAAMEAHASQIGPDSWFLSMPEDAFSEVFGSEWYVRRPFTGDPVTDREEWLR